MTHIEETQTLRLVIATVVLHALVSRGDVVIDATITTAFDCADKILERLK